MCPYRHSIISLDWSVRIIQVVIHGSIISSLSQYKYPPPNGYAYIIILLHHYSKTTIAIPCKDIRNKKGLRKTG